ncbi:hypothetical protein Q5424_00290 [Conexibacter sp. JD483]|uniref:hypothetical protein n=1 Tax=unclassified Conexibacter TaxID=2627773 RepID=UPI00271AB41A|nr:MULTISPECIES: hypothetical protein [unclassified Conexibacter]MDO8184197.1 hypothetical protein [Conexibacter sp. CPCC 205706]MDO8197189.1 hypothetical protein [Conexibacter sp. CPCC 205762]MDR9367496.1 hypothetical protein [Conexibacter sp. JD483]
MRMRSRLVALAVGSCLASTVVGGSASAAFPDFSGCIRSTPNVFACIDIASFDGSMTIKGFRVPIGSSFGIRGTLAIDGTQPSGFRFVPPTGSTGIFAKPIQVPGGLLGIDFPIPGNAVTATAQLAGIPSRIQINPGTFEVRVPVKLALTNPIIGPGCSIGSTSSPVNLDLIVGTTSPPAPNRPISGRPGTFDFTNPNYVLVNGGRNVDNSFSIPGASGCGIGLGLINSIVNLKLKLPSASGNNEIVVDNNVAIGGL